MSILAGVKGYLTYVTLGYKSLLELRRSLGDVDPLNLIKDKDATLQKGQEHADVLTREFDKLKAWTRDLEVFAWREPE